MATVQHDLGVNPQHQVEVLSASLDTIMGALAAGTCDAQVSADDVVSFFALGIACILDNDTNVKTQQDVSAGVLSANLLTMRWIETLRREKEQNGRSLFQIIMDDRQGSFAEH